MPSTMLDSEMIARIERGGQLPTLPSAAVEYLRVADDPTMSAQRIARLIEVDPTLTVKVLAVANSPYYGYEKRISTVELAIAVLGTNRLKEIVSNVMMQALLVNIQPDVLDVKAFWRYCLYCAATARHLAKKLHYRVTSEAFVAALLHDIGILICAHCFPEDTLLINEHIIKDGYLRSNAERMVVGATHSQIGAWLTKRWNMPEQLVTAIRLHHSHEQTKPVVGEETPQGHLELTELVELTELLALCGGFMNWNEPPCEIRIRSAQEKILNILPEEYMPYKDSLSHLLEELASEYKLASSITI